MYLAQDCARDDCVFKALSEDPNNAHCLRCCTFFFGDWRWRVQRYVDRVKVLEAVQVLWPSSGIQRDQGAVGHVRTDGGIQRPGGAHPTSTSRDTCPRRPSVQYFRGNILQCVTSWLACRHGLLVTCCGRPCDGESPHLALGVAARTETHSTLQKVGVECRGKIPQLNKGVFK